jgi:hypothetical protein
MNLRGVLGALLVLFMSCATPMGVQAQEQPASPSPAATSSAPATCAHPNAAPRIVTASQPETPDADAFYGVSGNVLVEIKLDAASRITDARIIKSPSPIFDAASLESARNSTYQTEVINCHAVAKAFTFIVTFDAPASGPKLYEDPMKYFPGAWSCSSGASTRSVTVTRSDAGGTPSLIFESDGSAPQILLADQGHFWHLGSPGGVHLTAFPWVTAFWHFISEKSEIDYTRVDANTFVRTDRTLHDNGDVIITNTRCVKNSTTKA